MGEDFGRIVGSFEHHGAEARSLEGWDLAPDILESQGNILKLAFFAGLFVCGSFEFEGIGGSVGDFFGHDEVEES